jgi:signal transduction histidine kinase
MFTNSIRWRLQLWVGFLLVCVLSGFGMTAYQLHRTNQFNQLDQELERRVEALGSAMRTRFRAEWRMVRPPSGERPGRPPPDDGPERRPLGRRPGEPPGREPPPKGHGGREIVLPQEVLNLFNEGGNNAFYFVLWSRDGDVLQSSTNAPADLPRPLGAQPRAATRARTRGCFREAYYFNSLGECALAGRNITADLQAQRRFAWLLLAAGGTVLAFGLGGGWWFTTRAIRPVEEISAAASRISAGNLSERIRAADPDNELGRLAGVLNSTFARLEAAFAQQKQFTADASHELRTPLAVLISEAQTTLARERTTAEYRETVEACLAAAQQMRQLTDSLLDLARLDAGQESMKRERFDLAQKARDCVELIRPLAARRRIQVYCDLQAAHCLGDPDRLGQVITNLLTNAIHYNREGGEVRITAATDAGSTLLTVTDNGPGIPLEDQPHLFERFYRVDKARSRAHGGTGLGLAISKAIVDAHGGGIEVSSQPGAGATFTVRLPAE